MGYKRKSSASVGNSSKEKIGRSKKAMILSHKRKFWRSKMHCLFTVNSAKRHEKCLSVTTTQLKEYIYSYEVVKIVLAFQGFEK